MGSTGKSFEECDCDPFASSGCMDEHDAVALLAGHGLSEEDICAVLAYAREVELPSPLRASGSTVSYLPLLHLQCSDFWRVEELVRCRLRRLSFEWGCTEDMRVLYSNFSQSDVDDIVSVSMFQETLSEMECEISSEEASWILAQMHISYTPGDTREKLKKRAFGYPEFISFVVDPNLVSDVLPRFFDAVASIDLNGIERVRSRIEGCDKIGSRTISFEDFQNIVGHVFASSASRRFKP